MRDIAVGLLIGLEIDFEFIVFIVPLNTDGAYFGYIVLIWAAIHLGLVFLIFRRYPALPWQ